MTSFDDAELANVRGAPTEALAAEHLSTDDDLRLPRDVRTVFQGGTFLLVAPRSLLSRGRNCPAERAGFRADAVAAADNALLGAMACAARPSRARDHTAAIRRDCRPYDGPHRASGRLGRKAAGGPTEIAG